MKSWFSALIILVLASLAAWTALRPGPERQAAQPWTAPPRPTLLVFDVPGPQGQRVQARFYGLERLAPTGHDLCAALREALPGVATAPDNLDELRATWRRACGSDPDPEGEPMTAEGRTREALQLLTVVSGTPGSGRSSSDWAVLGTRWALERLRTAGTAEEVEAVLEGNCATSMSWPVAPIALRRIAADCQRLRAEFCPRGPERAGCEARFLSEVGEDLARLGRLETDEQHFRDMTEVLDQAEALARRMPDRVEREPVLERIVVSFGYAGEFGRDERLLRRANEIAQANLDAFGPEDALPGEDVVRFGFALETLATTLSRLAVVHPDRIPATRRAIDAQRRAIDFHARHTPDRFNWGAHINLAADLRDLFELAGEAEVIEEAVAKARIALAILEQWQAARGGGSDEQILYVKARLGQALAWQGRRAPDLTAETRAALLAEARTLLEEAQRAFSRMNARAYLNFIRPALAMAREAEGQ